MSGSSTDPHTVEAQASSSRGHDENETDSDGEDDPVHLTLDRSVLIDDPLGEQPQAPLVLTSHGIGLC